MTSRKYHTHYVPTGSTMSHSLLKMDLCSMEKPSSYLHQKGRRSLVLCTNHIKASPKHSCLLMVVFSSLVSTRPLRWLFGNVKMHEISGPECCSTTDINTYTFMSLADMCIRLCTLDGMDYLILADFYSKVILVCHLPTGQSNSAKVIQILEGWFCDHGTPEVQCTDNGLQYASATFVDCSFEWGFTHETSSPHYPQSNGFAESSTHCNMPNTMVQIQGLHYSTWRLPQLMPNFPHPLRCCTTTRYVPPYLLGFIISWRK